MEIPPLILEQFLAPSLSPEQMDALWAGGWRHFGPEFFRYSVSFQGELGEHWDTVLPLRVDLSRFAPTKSQRRVLRKNADVRVSVAPARLSAEARAMFHRHKARFSDNVPEDLEQFLGPEPASVPGRCVEFRCHLGNDLVALSWLDVGATAVSSVYAIFEPAQARRGLGIFTLLVELLWARERGMRHAYPGYATLGPGHYDYKKRFTGLEGYDWERGVWTHFALRSPGGTPG